MAVHSWPVHAWRLYLSQIAVFFQSLLLPLPFHISIISSLSQSSSIMPQSHTWLIMFVSHSISWSPPYLSSIAVTSQVPGACTFLRDFSASSTLAVVIGEWSPSPWPTIMNSNSAPYSVWGWWFSRLPKCSTYWHNQSSFISRILPSGSLRMLDTDWHLSSFLLKHLYTSSKSSFLAASYSLVASSSHYHSLFSLMHWFHPHLSHLYSPSLPLSLVALHCSMMLSVHLVIHSFHSIQLVGPMTTFVTSWMAPFETSWLTTLSSSEHILLKLKKKRWEINKQELENNETDEDSDANETVNMGNQADISVNSPCGRCKEVVKDEDEAMECEVCEQWSHIKCQNITKAEYI